jgi:hypothetical protein
MTYWVQNSATRKIFVGIIVLVVVLGVSIPLTVFALNNDEEDLQIVPVPSEPAVASITPVEGNGPTDSPADPAVLGQDTPTTVNEPNEVIPHASEPAPNSEGSSPDVQPVAGPGDLIGEEVPVAVSVTPEGGEAGQELALTITVSNPFSYSRMSGLRVEVVQEGPVGFLAKSFSPVPYTPAEESEVVSFLIWEGLEVGPGGTLELSGKVRLSGSQEFSILANVQGSSQVLVGGGAVMEVK